MNRYSILAFGASAVMLSSMIGRQPSQRPNVLLILTDDQGWGDFGFNGNEMIHTPVLDSLQSVSSHLTNFYVSPLSASTRAGILTGRDHLRTGALSVTRSAESMDSDEITLAEALGDEGYRTGCFGKWHNGAFYPQDPKGQGFEEFVGFSAGHIANYFDTELQCNHSTIRSEGYITDYLTDRAIEFIDNSGEDNFFCYLPYNAPHAPIQVPEEFYANYKHLQTDPNDITPGVYAMCENIDYNIGRLLNHLRSKALLENTIVIFTTDNGPKNMRYNGDMRGCKGHLYEGGIKVPCLIYWQGRTISSQIDTTLSYVDLMPTILSLCGVEEPKLAGDREFTGLDFSSLLKGKPIARLLKKLEGRYLFTHKSPSESVLTSSQATIFNDRYKLVHNREGEYELYDKLNDPTESCDIASKEPKVLGSMMISLESWFEGVSEEYARSSSRYPQVGTIDYPVLIPSHEAIIQGSLRYNANKWGWAGDWLVDILPEDTISWGISVNTKGYYRLSLQYALPEGSPEVCVGVQGVHVEPVVLPAFNTQRVPSPDVVPRGVAYEQSWAIAPLCEVYLDGGDELLTLDVHCADNATIAAGLEIKGFMIEKIDLTKLN